MGMGAVALVLNVTVERVAQAPVSMNWIQSLAGQADPHLAAHLAAARQPSRRSARWRTRAGWGAACTPSSRRRSRRSRCGASSSGAISSDTRPAAALGGPFRDPRRDFFSRRGSRRRSGTASVGTADLPETRARRPGGQRRPEKAAGGAAAAVVARRDEPRARATTRCDLRPHRRARPRRRVPARRSDVRRARRAARLAAWPNASSFFAATRTPPPAGTPAWPRETSLTRNTARTPSALRVRRAACRRDARVDFEAPERIGRMFFQSTAFRRRRSRRRLGRVHKRRGLWFDPPPARFCTRAQVRWDRSSITSFGSPRKKFTRAYRRRRTPASSRRSATRVCSRTSR